MVDNLSHDDRIKAMHAVKSKNTNLERRIRAMLAGYKIKGWRMNPADVIGKPDFVFPEYKIAIFVDGCFWHGCPICQRSLPVTNKEYWEKKIANNVARDKGITTTLESSEWAVLRIWEHEIKNHANLKPTAMTIMAAMLAQKKNY